MNRFWLVLVVISCLSSPAYSKNAVAITIDGLNETPQIRDELRTDVEARLNGTDRYYITEPKVASLLLDLTCLADVNQSGTLRRLTCQSEAVYYPFVAIGLSRDVAESGIIVESANTETIAKVSVNQMINSTTEAKLNAIKEQMKGAITMYLLANFADLCKSINKPKASQ